MQREIDVLKHCQKGSSQSFELIVERYQALICAITFASTSNWEKSEELAQETFLLAWKNLRQLRDLSKFKPWLCQIARNVIQNWRRTVRRDVIEQASELNKKVLQSTTEASPADHIIREEEQAVVRQAMEEIPEKYRLPLILFYRENKSNREVAHIIGLSEVATRQRIARARGMLKDQVSAMVENTLTQSKPGKAFTGAVIASIAGATLKGTATATAAGVGAWILSTGLSGLMTKATIVAAGLAVITGIPYLVHRQNSLNPRQESVDSSQTLVVEPNTVSIMPPHPIHRTREENTQAAGAESYALASLVEQVDNHTNQSPSSTSHQKVPDDITHAVNENSLALTVVNKKDGTPLSGVTLTIRQNSKKQTAVTDKNGQYQIDFTNPRPDYLSITAIAEGIVPTRISFRSEEHDTIPKQLRMHVEAGTSIGGLIHNENGRPIEGATVFLLVPNELYTSLEKPAIWDHKVITDANGLWQCDIVPAQLEDVWIRLTHPDYIDDTTYGATEKPTIPELRANTGTMVMQRGINVAGWVFDKESNPIAGATVAQGSDRWGSHYPKTKTNKEGYFTFANAKSQNKMILTVQAKGYSPDLKSVVPTKNMEDILFTLESGHRISGQIVDSNDQPIQGAFIAADTWRSHRSVKWRRKSNHQGRFTWNDAPADEVLFDMGQKGYMYVRGFPMKGGSPDYKIVLPPPLTITGTVTYQDSNEPATDYTITHGYANKDGGCGYWSKRDTKTYHQSHYTRTFNEHREHGFLLRVEAENYESAVSRVILSNEGQVQIDFVLSPLSENSTLHGTVLLPDGSPAASADVDIATVDKGLSIRNGEIIQKREHLYYRTTDGGGHFSLRKPEQDYVIVAVHDQGFARLNAEEFNQLKVLALKPWAHIEGILMIGADPGSHERIATHMQQPYIPDQPRIHWYNDAKTDQNGHFLCEKVYPGSVQIYHEIKVGTHRTAPAQSQNIYTTSGETHHVDIGGWGCPVIGQVVFPKGMQKKGEWGPFAPRIQTERPQSMPTPSYPPNFALMTFAEQSQWSKDWIQSEAFKQTIETERTEHRSYPLLITEDGTFRVEDVLAGSYTVSLDYYQASNDRYRGNRENLIASGSLSFKIPFMENGRSDEPYDIGIIQLIENKPLVVGEVAQTFDITDLQGHSYNLADLQGRYILLHFWQLVRPETVEDIHALKRISEAYSSSGNQLTIIGITSGMPQDIIRTFTEYHNIPWPQVALTENELRLHTRLRQYLKQTQVASYLISPEGLLLTEPLTIAEIEAFLKVEIQP